MVLRILLIFKGHKNEMKRRKTCQQVEKGKREEKDLKFQKSISVCRMYYVSSLFIEKIHNEYMRIIGNN